MTDELKPVRCGCGGEAHYEAYENYNFGSYIAHIMICDKCGMRTAECPSEAEAVTAWNKAMGKIPVKVEVVTAKNGRTWEQCSRCFNEVYYNLPYCPGCGARLEWK